MCSITFASYTVLVLFVFWLLLSFCVRWFQFGLEFGVFVSRFTSASVLPEIQ